ncbi:hypothetical protein, partial [Flagellimonas onchidii]|uniref:hypothetical protein n=1 Tax=Flagellimonas onchidii TaxID=2562684 RepID=UPI0014561B55
NNGALEVNTGNGIRAGFGRLEVNIGNGLRFDAFGVLEVVNTNPVNFLTNSGSSVETYTLNENDYMVILSGNAFNIGLPILNNDNMGRVYHIVNLSNKPANFIGANVQGFTLSEIVRTIPANSSLTIQSTGIWWQIIGNRLNPGSGLEIALGELKARIGSGLVFDGERRIAVSNIKPLINVGNNLVGPVESVTLDHTHHTVFINSERIRIIFPEAGEHTGRVYCIVNKTSTPRDIGRNLRNFNGMQLSTIPGHSSMEFQSNGVTWERLR